MQFLLLCGLVHTLCSFAWGAPTENEIHDAVYIVNTRYGLVDGIRENSNTNKNVIAYYGIPYAQPPTGPNRFRPPVALEDKKSEEVFHAEHIPLPCYQNPPSYTRSKRPNMVRNRPWSEDCLKLNIWIPKAGLTGDTPVVVYFHPGGFYMGTSVSESGNGATLAAEENVIVVSVNYRLGVLGFMSLGIDDAPGNMGLMDQQLALKWVFDCIIGFGGDRHQITLLGVSAGSASVGYHILLDSSRGLFHRAILMSGVPTNVWASHSLPSVVKKTKNVANYLGYHGPDTPQDILNFLKAQHVEDLIDANDFKNLLTGDVIAPIVDGHLVKDNPHHLLDKNDTDTNVDVLIGTVKDEGSLIMKTVFKPLFKDNPNGIIGKEDFAYLFHEVDNHIDSWVSDAITNNYIDYTRKGDPYMYRDQAAHAIGDYLFTCDIEGFADHLALYGHKVYRYIYDNKPASGHNDDWLTVYHGSDAPIVFGSTLGKSHSSEKDLTFARNIMHTVGNFIKTGNPNLDDEHHKDNPWPLYNLEDRSVKVLSPGNCTIVHHPGSYHCAVMRYLVPMVFKVSHCDRGEKHHGSEVAETHHPHHCEVIQE